MLDSRAVSRTPLRVRVSDSVAGMLIAVGGIGTILVLLLVVFVLLATTLPLLENPEPVEWRRIANTDYLRNGSDRTGMTLWGLRPDGGIETYSLPKSTQPPLLLAEPLFSQAENSKSNDRITCTQFDAASGTLIIGLNTGEVVACSIETQAALIASSTPAFAPIAWSERVKVSTHAIAQIDFVVTSNVTRGPTQSLPDLRIAAVCNLPDGQFELTIGMLRGLGTNDAQTPPDVAGRALTSKLARSARGVFSARSADQAPMSIALMESGDAALVAWPTGTVDAFQLAQDTIRLDHTINVTLGGQSIVSAASLFGRRTLLLGGEDGTLYGVKPQLPHLATWRGEAPSAIRLSVTNAMKLAESAILGIATSPTSRICATIDATGNTQIHSVPTETLLTEFASMQDAATFERIEFDATGRFLLGSSADGLFGANVRIEHPDATATALVRPVWYEDQDEPNYLWEPSKSGSTTQSKISLIPLLLGTCKAAVLALTFSVPLAIFAAIYTSEFLTPKSRALVRPSVELMASLPSVVLAYVAATVLAPLLSTHLMPLLTSLVVVPATLVVGGHLWNLLPQVLRSKFNRGKFGCIALCIPVGVWLSLRLGRFAELLWFEGDIIAWLNQERISSATDSAAGGWVLVCIPPLALLVAFLNVGTLSDWIRSRGSKMRRSSFPFLYLVRLLLSFTLVIGVASLAGWIFDLLGWDLRHFFRSEYEDGNALLVGATLGFCVVPIIFTIAEDALQTVPPALRSASIACGATKWQTAMRIVVPTATSGLLAAVSIGFGRAVGETMVVLLASRAAPGIDWNPFTAVSTFTTTIARELPTSVPNSTHFRTLFLAATLLFIFTLAANTVAELARSRFRRRTSQL